MCIRDRITIDSATLMNKGLELIEAVWLFGLPPEKIQIVVQRQSIVHSAVQFSDNSVIAQLGVPDMRIPIQYALCLLYTSPLAIEATRIFKDTDPDCFDADTRALLEKGIDPITFPGLRVTVTSDESRMINADRVPKVILSASGMCEAGRIRHHLKHNLWRPECTILFVGYQAVGTLGRTLIDGAVNVKLFGETIDVQAEICQLTGLSGHADREGLLAWVNAFSPKPKRVFVIHGEDEVENIFAQTLTEQGFTACAPYNGEQWAIGAEGAVCLQEGSRVRLEHKPSEGASRAATVFQRLVSAGKRLLRVIEHNEGGANKDLAKFADQINALCDKWDR